MAGECSCFFASFYFATISSGPIAGGTFPVGHSAPRAVSFEYFQKVCPKKKIKVLYVEEINRGLEGAEVIDIMNKYVEILKNMDEGCVQLEGGLKHPFDYL